jgi:hypothetical protein
MNFSLALAIATALILNCQTADARDIHASVASRRFAKRQVPQEHSHDKITDFMRDKCFNANRGGLADPIFGLLGDGK